jgi:hypothetical protein
MNTRLLLRAPLFVVMTGAAPLYGACSNSSSGAAGAPCGTSSDCGDKLFCNTPGRCGNAGTCQAIPSACPASYDPVCGCNGESYSNECLAQWGDMSPISSVAYGGNCRASAIVSCNTGSQCSSEQVCALDPRSPCDGGTGCKGFCVTAGTSAIQIQSCEQFGCDSDTRACVRAACDGGAWSCAFCAYTSGLTCAADSDCPSGQICTPAASCSGAGACSSYCVAP